MPDVREYDGAKKERSAGQMPCLVFFFIHLGHVMAVPDEEGLQTLASGKSCTRNIPYRCQDHI